MAQQISSSSSARSSTSRSHSTQQGGSKAIETIGRIGYATKGVVYMIVGGLAIAAAWGAWGASAEQANSKNAISEIGSQPFGQAMLWVVAIGLAAYCVWRLIEAVTDPGGEGSDAKGIGKRVGYAVSGLAYGMLAMTAAPISMGGGSGGDSKQDLAGSVMAMPGGKWIVGIVGLIVVGYGAYQIYKGATDKFTDKYNTGEMSETEQKVAKYSGRVGLPARGVTFGVIGMFVIIAAVTLDPSKVKGTGEALDVLAAQPYGSWVLLAVAIGLFCYGVFCLVQSRYRTFQAGAKHNPA